MFVRTDLHNCQRSGHAAGVATGLQVLEINATTDNVGVERMGKLKIEEKNRIEKKFFF